MSDKFDELTKGLAQSVTRRQALKKFGVGLAGMALACVGLANKAEASSQPPRAEAIDEGVGSPRVVAAGLAEHFAGQRDAGY